MANSEALLLTYLQLARASQLRRQPLVCDKLLVLGGVAACELGWDDIALGCRQIVLRHNPRHLVRRWPTLSIALESERFRSYYEQLKRKYSPEKAEHMLDALGITVDDGPDGRQPAQHRAASLLDALADFAAAADRSRLAGPSPPAARGRRASAAEVAGAKTLAMPAVWWPFWLGLAAWTVLTVVWLVFRR